MFSLFGWAGQSLFNELDARHTQKIHSSIASSTAEPVSEAQPTSPRPAAPFTPTNFLQRIAAMKYSPIQNLSDADYETMLQERLLRVDAEIALVDEKIEMVKQELEKGRAAGDGAGKQDQIETSAIEKKE